MATNNSETVALATSGHRMMRFLHQLVIDPARHPEVLTVDHVTLLMAQHAHASPKDHIWREFIVDCVVLCSRQCSQRVASADPAANASMSLLARACLS